MKMSDWLPRMAEKATRRPSGEKVGASCCSSPGISMVRTIAPVSGLMISRLRPRSRRTKSAI
jgi:hypothetical protein